MFLKAIQVLIRLKFQILLKLSYNLKQLNLQLKKLIELLTQLKDFEFVTTVNLVYKKIESEDKRKYDNFHSSSKAETIINKSDINDMFQSIYTKL